MIDLDVPVAQAPMAGGRAIPAGQLVVELATEAAAALGRARHHLEQGSPPT